MNKLVYAMVGVLTVLGIVVVLFPAGTAWSIAEDEVRRELPNLGVEQVQGTVWSGSANAWLGVTPPLKVSWSLDPLPLLTGAANVEALLGGSGVDGEFDISVTSQEARFSGVAAVDSRYLNQVTINYGLQTSGAFDLTMLNLVAVGDRLTELEGRLEWTGGIVHIETPLELLTRQLPPFVADLSLDSEQVPLVTVRAEGSEVLRIRLKPDGWAEITVFRALIRIADLPFPGMEEGDGSEIALILEEQLF